MKSYTPRLCFSSARPLFVSNKIETAAETSQIWSFRTVVARVAATGPRPNAKDVSSRGTRLLYALLHGVARASSGLNIKF